MNKTTFEQVIEKTGRLIYTNKGDSMMPLIKEGRDILIIEKPTYPLKKYDVPLYKRDSGQYVLHRIIQVRKDDYVTMGDNRINKEYGITDRHIIGVLKGINRSGKNISVDDTGYKLYVRLWYFIFPIRYIWVRSKNLFRIVKRKF